MEGNLTPLPARTPGSFATSSRSKRPQNCLRHHLFGEQKQTKCMFKSRCKKRSIKATHIFELQMEPGQPWSGVGACAGHQGTPRPRSRKAETPEMMFVAWFGLKVITQVIGVVHSFFFIFLAPGWPCTGCTVRPLDAAVGCKFCEHYIDCDLSFSLIVHLVIPIALASIFLVCCSILSAWFIQNLVLICPISPNASQLSERFSMDFLPIFWFALILWYQLSIYCLYMFIL